MEEIREILLEIAEILNKEQRFLKDDEFLFFKSGIEKYTVNQLASYACNFLNRTMIYRFGYSLPKTIASLFERLKNCFIAYCFISKRSPQKDVAMLIRDLSEKKYISFLDTHFDDKIGKNIPNTRKINIIVPYEELYPMLDDYYMFGGEYEEKYIDNNPINMPSAGVIILPGGLKVVVHTYLISSNGLLFYIVNSKNGKVEKFELPIKFINAYSKKISNKLSVLAPEFTYIDALNGGGVSDFVELMEVKNFVNMRKLASIEKKIKTSMIVKEEKNHGFQKTS